MIGTAVVLPGIFGYSSVIGFISRADPGANFVLSAVFGFLLMAPSGFIYIYNDVPYDWVGIFKLWLPTSGSIVWKSGVVSGFLVDPVWAGADDRAHIQQ